MPIQARRRQERTVSASGTLSAMIAGLASAFACHAGKRTFRLVFELPSVRGCREVWPVTALVV
jgi:hypothetical protein